MRNISLEACGYMALALCAAVAGIIAHLVRNRKKGKSSCGCDCGHCPMGGSCGHD